MDAEVSQLYRIFKTVNEMLDDRGYTVADEDAKVNLESFMQKYEGLSGSQIRQDLIRLVAKNDDPTDELYVFFDETKRFGVKNIRDYHDNFMKPKNVKRAILVCKGVVTSYARQAIEVMHTNLTVERFLEAELMVNITHHELVPKHEVLTLEQTRLLLERYKLKPEQLPCIQAADAVARYYGLKVGEVVKITRPSETAGRYVTYRRVQ
jgi:DNA-directed RNA polymerase I, II, and III subunit RPABC1